MKKTTSDVESMQNDSAPIKKDVEVVRLEDAKKNVKSKIVKDIFKPQQTEVIIRCMTMNDTKNILSLYKNRDSKKEDNEDNE